MYNEKEFFATAITLKHYDFGESDRILHLFTKEQGLVQVLAKGVKKTKSKFGGRLDLLNVNELVIRKGRNLGTIIQCENTISFPLLRLDYDKLIYSLFLGELILLFSSEGEASETLFNLLLYALKNMEKSKKPIIDSLWFQLQFLKIQGYHSKFSNCDICQNDNLTESKKLGFSLVSGNIICEKCLIKTKNYKIIDLNTLNCMKKISFSELPSLFDLKYSDLILDKIQEILKNYLSILSERKIKTLSIL